jgi:hypothetical protein
MNGIRLFLRLMNWSEMLDCDGGGYLGFAYHNRVQTGPSGCLCLHQNVITAHGHGQFEASGSRQLL